MVWMFNTHAFNDLLINLSCLSHWSAHALLIITAGDTRCILASLFQYPAWQAYEREGVGKRKRIRDKKPRSVGGVNSLSLRSPLPFILRRLLFQQT